VFSFNDRKLLKGLHSFRKNMMVNKNPNKSTTYFCSGLTLLWNKSGKLKKGFY